MKVGIIGSEATRGIFIFNAFDVSLYKTEIISYQTTTVSNVAIPVKNSVDFSDYSTWDRMIVENNLNKVWVQRLQSFTPEVVVVDFVSDVMYTSVRHDGSVVTRNPVMLKHLKNELVDRTRIFSDEDDFVKGWLVACNRLVGTIREICPKALVVLHSAPLMNTYIDKEGIPRKVRRDDYEEKDALLKRINSEGECMFDVVIKSDPFKFHGHELHPWGLGLAKYENKYNTHMLGLFANKVLETKFKGSE